MSSRFSDVALHQIAALAKGPDRDLYDAVVEVCMLALANPPRAQSMSSVIVSLGGTVLRLPVMGQPPHKVFWTSALPRIEAVFPHP
jgi:hypothetical protein